MLCILSRFSNLTQLSNIVSSEATKDMLVFSHHVALLGKASRGELNWLVEWARRNLESMNNDDINLVNFALLGKASCGEESTWVVFGTAAWPPRGMASVADPETG
jgi:hypothetical protein